MAPTDSGPTTVGAHFSALAVEHNHAPPGRYGYDSARSCLFALVRERTPTTVHLPNYLCAAVRQAVEAAGCQARPYEIGPNFHARGVEMKRGELLILVNYYGLCASAVEAQLTAVPRDAVVVDNSHAFFEAPFDALATIYSPRKFLPVPDGGFIEIDADLRQDPPNEAASMRRFNYLVERVGSPPESTRAHYLTSEESFERPSLAAMSELTRRWVCAQDQNAISARRRANYQVLAKRFGANRLTFDLGPQTPLCYPLAVEDGVDLQRRLAMERIFCPRYWPEVVPANAFERTLVERTVFLPIDHRYSTEDMHRVADVVSDLQRGTSG
ncbi:hypothetical protein [Brevundimonas albigilva]|uniref:DegT/DnrJ/EryC1/StrS aminotransferase family protein n=1 Tax=Brevundimonas albigilva TaxID=1312364 RepID=A0ABY4SQD2_9CAUL|nr:hypothetical protein [Brevundimonas albigilva]URI15033.1 hypothetical protein M8231_14740 [Brevundimonas albigilva]